MSKAAALIAEEQDNDHSKEQLDEIQASKVRESGWTETTSEARERFMEALPPAPPLPKIEQTDGLPSFEQALEEVSILKQGDNKAADGLSHKYGSKHLKYVKRDPHAQDGGPGWHCLGREDGPLTREQSEELAQLINEKIDVEKMKEDAEAARKKKEKKKARKAVKKEESKETPESSDKKVPEGMKEDIQELNGTNIHKLTKIALDARTLELLDVKMDGRIIKDVKAKEGIEGAEELEKLIITKKKELLENIREEKHYDRRAAGLVKKMATKDSDKALKGWVASFLDRELGVIEFVPEANGKWTVKAIEGKPRSEQVVKAVLDRKAKLVKETKARLMKKYSRNR